MIDSLIWIGGFLAAVIYSWIADGSEDKSPIDGVIAGILVGIVAAVANAAFIAFSTQPDLSQIPQPGADIAPFIDSIQTKMGFSNLWQTEQLLLFVVQLIAYLVVGTISGYIGGLLFLRPSPKVIRPRH